MPTAPPKEFACLVGNGLSIAYNSDLEMDALTDGMLAGLAELAGDAAAEALSGFAQALSNAGTLNFENLLSPLDDVSRALPSLSGAAPLIPGQSDAILEAANALAAIHRVGLSTVLELISERAYGAGEEQLEPIVKRVCRAINSLPTEKGIAVGTLNYDGLIHAGFLDIPSVVDLVPGYVPIVQHQIAPDVSIGGRSLRRSANFGQARIRILNMHGSLSWLWNLSEHDAVKFEFQALRDTAYWNHLRQGTATRVPVVVLTDQKQAAIEEWPFSLAYAAFETALGFATHWLIAGYGFEDEPLNAVLRDAVETQRRFNRAPRVLVIDFGRDPALWRDHVAEVMSLTSSQIQVDVTGLPDAVEGSEWNGWKDAA